MYSDIDLQNEDSEEWYVNPKYLSFSPDYDKFDPPLPISNSYLSRNFSHLSENFVSPDPSVDNSFINKYLFQQTPEQSKLNSKEKQSVPKLKMEKLGHCRKFSGYPKDNAQKFIKEFESFSKLHELDDEDDDSRKLAAFHLHLQGPALTWYNGLSDDLDYDTVYQLFNDKYVNIGWQHPSVVVENETFQNMILLPTQEIEDYYCHIVEKGKLLGKPEPEVMFKFINGLPEKLAFYVRTSQPNDLSEALMLAKTGEAYKYRVHDKPMVAAAKALPRNDDISNLQQQLGELTTMVQKLSTNNSRKFSNTGPPKNQSQTSKPVCFNCNSQGHVRKYCNWNGSGNASPDILCQLCKQFGHTAMQCARLRPELGNTAKPPQVCQICLKFGHEAPNCFRLQQSGFQSQHSGFPSQQPGFQSQQSGFPSQHLGFQQQKQENWTPLGDIGHGHPGKK